ncbi:NYN domain-containing protein [Coprinopsis sp. MPI-PUGE-AT-0042]|nr:NYN domain-containing protein [Coprinopsis sp. MPI-PUGE-AT-0042]
MSNRLVSHSQNRVGCFWDYENLPAKQSGNSAIGYVAAFQEIAKRQGIVTMFKAYLQINHALSKKARQEYQSMGVTLVDCPHAGKKEVADKIMIVDMMLFASDNPPPSTIVVATGDNDFSYALSMLRLRGHTIVQIVGNNYPSGAKIDRSQTLLYTWSSLRVRAKALADMHPAERASALQSVGRIEAPSADLKGEGEDKHQHNEEEGEGEGHKGDGQTECEDTSEDGNASQLASDSEEETSDDSGYGGSGPEGRRTLRLLSLDRVVRLFCPCHGKSSSEEGVAQPTSDDSRRNHGSSSEASEEEDSDGLEEPRQSNDEDEASGGSDDGGLRGRKRKFAGWENDGEDSDGEESEEESEDEIEDDSEDENMDESEEEEEEDTHIYAESNQASGLSQLHSSPARKRRRLRVLSKKQLKRFKPIVTCIIDQQLHQHGRNQTLKDLKKGGGWKALAKACYKSGFKNLYEYVHRAADAGLLFPITGAGILVPTQLAWDMVDD